MTGYKGGGRRTPQPSFRGASPARAAVQPRPIQQWRSINNRTSAVRHNPVRVTTNTSAAQNRSTGVHISNPAVKKTDLATGSGLSLSAAGVKNTVQQANNFAYKTTVKQTGNLAARGAVKARLTYNNLKNRKFKNEGAYNPVRGSLFNKIKGVCEGAKENPKSGRGDILHGSVITPKDIKNFFNGLGNETNKLINSSLKYTGEVIKGIGKFIDKNLDNITTAAIIVAGTALVVGATAATFGAAPILIASAFGSTVIVSGSTAAAYLGGTAVIAGGIGAFSSLANVATGAVGYNLALEKLDNSERINRVVSGTIGTVLNATNIYLGAGMYSTNINRESLTGIYKNHSSQSNYQSEYQKIDLNNNYDIKFNEWINKGEKDTKVYFAYDSEGNALYTGITKQNLEDRLAQHQKLKSFYYLAEVYENEFTRNQARAIEQYYIENGPNLYNKINSISKNNVHYINAAKWATDYINSGGSK